MIVIVSYRALKRQPVLRGSCREVVARAARSIIIRVRRKSKVNAVRILQNYLAGEAIQEEHRPAKRIFKNLWIEQMQILPGWKTNKKYIMPAPGSHHPMRLI